MYIRNSAICYYLIEPHNRIREDHQPANQSQQCPNMRLKLFLPLKSQVYRMGKHVQFTHIVEQVTQWIRLITPVILFFEFHWRCLHI